MGALLDTKNNCGNCGDQYDEQVQGNKIISTCPNCGRKVVTDKNYQNAQVLNEGKEQEDDEEEDEEDSDQEEEDEEEEETRPTPSPKQPKPNSGTVIVPPMKSNARSPIVIYLGLGLVIIVALVVGLLMSASLMIGAIALAVILIGLAVIGIRQVRPTERGLIERFGKYNRFAMPGLVVMWPLIEQLIVVNITEQLVPVTGDRIITKDSLNLDVNAQIYYKIEEDEESVKKSQYAVNSYEVQIINLANTTLRNVIGSMTFADANSNRGAINNDLASQLEPQVEQWGLRIVRGELSSLNPPEDVQQAMNDVIKADQKKTAAINNANAVETEANGLQRAAVQKATGVQQAAILEAQGEAKAIVTVAEAKAKEIELVNTAAKQFFVDGAITLEQLKTIQTAFKDNSKIILAKDGSNFINVIGELGQQVLPIPGVKK